MRVDEATVDFRTLDFVGQFAPEDETPEPIQEFEVIAASVRPQPDSTGAVLDVGNAHGERRYYEGRIEPGEDVYLLGDAQPKDDANPGRLRPEDAVVRPGDERFLLSGRSESELIGATRLGFVLLVCGLLIVGVGVWVLLG